MKISPYLHFNGQCKTAFAFYEKCFEGKIVVMMSHEDAPIATEVPPEWKKKIMYVCLDVEDQTLMGSDVPPEYYQTPQGFRVAITLKDPDRADRVFDDLSEGGTVQMSLQETFWAAKFGMLTDRFGIPWMLSCAKPA